MFGERVITDILVEFKDYWDMKMKSSSLLFYRYAPIAIVVFKWACKDFCLKHFRIALRRELYFV